MLSVDTKHYNFYFDFLEKDAVPSLFYTSNSSSNSNFNKNSRYKDIFSKGLHVVSYMPSYFQFADSELPSHLSYIYSFRDFGFLINLEGYVNIQQYMKRELGSHRRQVLKRIKRLEVCFNPTYKLFYGTISKEEYSALFDKMKGFLEERFLERKEESSQLLRWHHYRDSVYDLIQQKRASIFVIYNGSVPISISLNYHCEDTMIHSLNSFDTRYSKFGLGNIAIFKLLEWCFQNKYSLFDFEWGDLAYKKKWANKQERYKIVIIYPNASIFYKVFARFKLAMYSLKDFVVKKRIQILEFLYKWHSKLFLVNLSQNKTNNDGYEFCGMDMLESNYELIPIPINYSKKEPLVKPVIDFQYLNSETSSSIEIFGLNLYPDMYMIKGKEKMQWFRLYKG
ncbi:MAG: GNAT family N-acetyltransferase [Bacteroidota bacterium]